MSTYATAQSTTDTLIPAGRWEVDPAHSTVEFRVRHAGLARVRGTFEEFEGTLDAGSDGTLTARGSVTAASLGTRVAARDEHLRSADFLDVGRHPRLTFTSTAIEAGAGGSLTVRGELTIRGVTREIELTGELLGTGHDDEGAERVGLELSGRLDRRDFGLTWNAAVEGGGLLVGHRVDLALEVSAVRRA
jgi:polyisoprenoid-binding protein YceI